MDQIKKEYLAPTQIIDSNHETIIKYANNVVGNTGEYLTDRAVKLFYAVRDNIWYDPYYPFYLPEHYRASNVLKAVEDIVSVKRRFYALLEGHVAFHPGLDLLRSAIILPPKS